MNERDLMWLAGYLEGEGCFHMGEHTPSVRVAATDKDVVERAAQLMGGSVRGKTASPHPRHKPMFYSNVYGQKAIDLMTLLQPYLGERRSARITEVLGLAAARPGPGRYSRSR